MQHKPCKPLILIDGSSYLFRAFHALPPLTNSKGSPTGAIYGVINMLRKLIKDEDPDYIGVIFDPKGKTFRNDLYPEYKANRVAMPDDLACQIKPLFDVIKAMGLPLIIIDGVEADDVIGTLAVAAEKAGMKTLISTGDKDMAQLVNQNTTLINTMTDKVMDEQTVPEKFGVRPHQIIDYLTLVGDTVDNIPGVPKVGPKTAAKWLAEYQTLDNIIEHADEFKGKIGEYLRNSLEQLPLSKQLVTIKLDVPLDFEITDLKPKEKNTAMLTNLFQELEFKTWLREVHEAPEAEQKVYDIIFTKDVFNTWLEKIKSADYFAFDTETTSLDYMQAELVGLSFSVKKGEAAYVPLTHNYEDAPEQLDRDWVLAQLQPILQDKNKSIIGQNLKYDLSVLAKYDISIDNKIFDTMLESFVFAGSGRHDMDSLALKYLGKKTISYEEIAGKGAKQLCFNQIDIKVAGQYAAEDADITLQLHQHLWPKLQEQPNLIKALEENEFPLVSILSKVERTGVLIDPEKLNQQSKELDNTLTKLQKQAYKEAGEEFNLSSTKQLQTILFEKMQLPVLQKTPKGQPSTAENVLQELAEDYKLPKIILNYRSLSKLKSTYTDKLPLQIYNNTSRVHTSYHQVGAATGRFSSTDPNLQNIPVRTEEGRRIRQAFIAPKNYKILAADYSQIELRIMAHLSQDKGLIEAFKNGLDIHKATAAEVFDIPLEEVNDIQRRSAKAINFGLIYGMSAFGLAKQLEVPRQEAQHFIDLYFSRYPGVKEYMERVREQAHDQGYVETHFGRKLYLPEINSNNMMRQKAAERAAINAPMQGTAADIIKRAMIAVDNKIKNNKNIHMIMQVHDELVFEVAENKLDEYTNLIKNAMTGAADLRVPLIVDVGVGTNWDEAH